MVAGDYTSYSRLAVGIRSHTLSPEEVMCRRGSEEHDSENAFLIGVGVGSNDDEEHDINAGTTHAATWTDAASSDAIHCGSSRYVPTIRQVACLVFGICAGLMVSACFLGTITERGSNNDNLPLSLHKSKDGFGDDVHVDVAAYCKGRPHKQCPPIEKFVRGTKVKRDISWMLDFAVVGTAKCGTSFLLRYLGNSSETLMPRYEVCKMSKNRPDEFVKLYYNASLVSGKYRPPSEGNVEERGEAAEAEAEAEPPRIMNGLKCPKELATELGLVNYAKYFPSMKYIVTTRHPVLWFQSFYNYRTYGNGKLPPPMDLIGSCVENSPYICSKRCAIKTSTQNVCTDRAKFHHQLSRFGKTPMDTKEENNLLKHDMEIVPSKGSKIFLMELGQLFPSEKASKNLARDLSNFLGLQHQLPRLEDVPPDSSKYTDKARRKYFINICDDEHQELRKKLVDIGNEAFVWIRDYFIKSPDVVVSSRDDFLELISKWSYDPCESEKN